MKFILVRSDSIKCWINPATIEFIDESGVPEAPSYIGFVGGRGKYYTETPEEILQKIAEAEHRERSFMDDWQDRVDKQLSKLTVRKDGSAE